MRLEDPTLPPASDGWARLLVTSLTPYLRRVVAQLNRLSDGRLEAVNSTGTAAPTTGTWARGDVVRNSAPAEAGSIGSKYVIIGWICVSAGTPGDWLPMRTLTGN